MRATSSRGWMLFALALTALGVVLLLQNFLLLGGLSLLTFWPLLLVVAGMALLLRGDWFTGSGKPFGITRGSVTNATLEVSAGVVDVRGRALPKEGRLIAGQFASGARPTLSVEDNHAFLRFDRASTPLLSLADWELALARDLPWDVRVTTWLGAVDLDFTGLIVQGASVATGFGDVRITCPQESFAPITVRSALGSIRLEAPEGVNARVYVTGSRVFRTHFDTERFEQIGEGLYLTRDVANGQPASEFHLSGSFGDCYLG
ncbi:MAG TPA: DUF5668 domain-containing protein [Candidatus Limnocylindrales bacterium]|nr:DUF5668 domain-containing protein [Candidatus Limnocylindrales bacterium]